MNTRKLLPIFIVVFWLSLIMLGVWTVYEIHMLDLSPEAIGEFFGKIAEGYNSVIDSPPEELTPELD